MTIQPIKFMFSLLFIGFLPLMGMEKYPTFQEAQKLISTTIEKNSRKYYGMSLEKQKSLDLDFDNNDIEKIAKNDINKGILLEQHLKDVRIITSTIPSKKSFTAIANIIKNSIDKQQKMVGLIECASFIGSPALTKLIEYALLNKNLIPTSVFEESDTTVKTFYQIKNVYDIKPTKTFNLAKEILPSLEKIREYSLDQNFDPIINDIKTIKYQWDEKLLGITDALSAFNITTIPNNPLQIQIQYKKLVLQQERTKIIKRLFNTTSLPNKIALILRLNDLNQLSSTNIALVKNFQENHNDTPHDARLSIATGLFYALWTNQKPTYSSLSWGLAITVFFTGYFKYNNPFTNLTTAIEDSLRVVGSGTLAPVPQLYFLYKYFFQPLPYDQELSEIKKEQKNIQNLMEEFKESVKKEYKN